MDIANSAASEVWSGKANGVNNVDSSFSNVMSFFESSDLHSLSTASPSTDASSIVPLNRNDCQTNVLHNSESMQMLIGAYQNTDDSSCASSVSETCLEGSDYHHHEESTVSTKSSTSTQIIIYPSSGDCKFLLPVVTSTNSNIPSTSDNMSMHDIDVEMPIVLVPGDLVTDGDCKTISPTSCPFPLDTSNQGIEQLCDVDASGDDPSQSCSEFASRNSSSPAAEGIPSSGPSIDDSEHIPFLTPIVYDLMVPKPCNKEEELIPSGQLTPFVQSNIPLHSPNQRSILHASTESSTKSRTSPSASLLPKRRGRKPKLGQRVTTGVPRITPKREPKASSNAQPLNEHESAEPMISLEKLHQFISTADINQLKDCLLAMYERCEKLKIENERLRRLRQPRLTTSEYDAMVERLMYAEQENKRLNRQNRSLGSRNRARKSGRPKKADIFTDQSLYSGVSRNDGSSGIGVASGSTYTNDFDTVSSGDDDDVIDDKTSDPDFRPYGSGGNGTGGSGSGNVVAHNYSKRYRERDVSSAPIKMTTGPLVGSDGLEEGEIKSDSLPDDFIFDEHEFERKAPVSGAYVDEENESLLDPQLGIVYDAPLRIDHPHHQVDTSTTHIVNGLSAVNGESTMSKFVCPQCGECFASQAEIKLHLPTHMPKFNCTMCPKVFGHDSYLQLHLWRVHNVDPDRPQSEQGEEVRGADGSSRREFKCGECERSFRYRSVFQQHMQHHRRAEPIRCEICNQEFANFSSLKVHYNYYHQAGGDPTVTCTVCGLKCKSKSALQAHKQTHNDKNEVCEHCGHTFATKRYLLNHITMWHDKLKKYKCDLCEKAFVKWDKLADHKRVHTREKPFLCSLCGKTFRKRDSLRAHTRHVHEHAPLPASAVRRNEEREAARIIREQKKIEEIALNPPKSKKIKPSRKSRAPGDVGLMSPNFPQMHMGQNQNGLPSMVPGMSPQRIRLPGNTLGNNGISGHNGGTPQPSHSVMHPMPANTPGAMSTSGHSNHHQQPHVSACSSPAVGSAVILNGTGHSPSNVSGGTGMATISNHHQAFDLQRQLLAMAHHNPNGINMMQSGSNTVGTALQPSQMGMQGLPQMRRNIIGGSATAAGFNLEPLHLGAFTPQSLHQQQLQTPNAIAPGQHTMAHGATQVRGPRHPVQQMVNVLEMPSVHPSMGQSNGVTQGVSSALGLDLANHQQNQYFGDSSNQARQMTAVPGWGLQFMWHQQDQNNQQFLPL